MKTNRTVGAMGFRRASLKMIEWEVRDWLRSA
jgi:hypothetical protein